LREIAIALAVQEEWRGLRGRLQERRPHMVGGLPATRGQLSGVPVFVFLTGSGKAASAQAAERALSAVEPACLVIAGFGAAVAPGPRPGDLVVATFVGAEGCADALPCDRHLQDAAARARPTGVAVFSGPLVTTAHVLIHPDEKARVAAETGAVVVDMESDPVARVAASLGIPFVAIRAVTDAANDTMPLDFNAHVDAAGYIRRGAIVAAAMRRPRSIAGLVRLGRDSARAARNLGAFLEALCAELGRAT